MTPEDERTRPPLTRDLILASALSYVDQYGLASLSMRQLGRVLGVEAMSLYRYVNGREDLLEGMVETVMRPVRFPPREPIGPSDGWQAFLMTVAHAIRSIAVEHPMTFPLVATRPPAAPWLRPPLRDLPMVNDFLDGLLARGLTDDQAVHIYRAFAGFLLGHLLLEVAESGANSSPPEEPLDEGGAEVPNEDQQLSLDDFPTVQRLESRLRKHDATHEFELALESLLDRLDRELSQ